ncbi:hypothetical protein SprV_0401659700 [Sparganum proliferum]
MEKSQILKCSTEHFRNILNRPSTISGATIDWLPQAEINVDLDLPASLPETVRAVQQFSSAKTSGSDVITAEIYKRGGHRLVNQFMTLFQVWHCGKIPQDFKDATIVHLYKCKGNRQVCDNHKGISLFNIAGKIFARIPLNFFSGHLEQGLLPESQCDSR